MKYRRKVNYLTGLATLACVGLGYAAIQSENYLLVPPMFLGTFVGLTVLGINSIARSQETNARQRSNLNSLEDSLEG